MSILLNFISRNAFWILFSFISSSFIGLILYLNTDKYYQSESIIEVYEESQSNSAIDQLSSLSNFGLGKIGSTNNSKKALEIIKSRSFANDLISLNDLLPELLAIKAFNQNLKKSIFDHELFDTVNNKFLGKFASKTEEELLSIAYNNYFDAVAISSTQNGFIKLNVLTKSPEFSKNLATLILNHYNDLERDRNLLKATNSIRYLQERLKEETNSAIRESLVKEQMLFERDRVKIYQRADYILSFIDGPNYPLNKAYPILLVYILSSVLFSLLLLFLRFAYQSTNGAISEKT